MTEAEVRPAPRSTRRRALAISTAEERISVATQWQLMWWRFKKHRLAMVSTVVVLLFYLVVIFADFLAYSDPLASEAQRSLLPPQRIHWFDEGRFSPHVFGLTGMRDPNTFKRVYTPDPAKKIPVRFFVRGFEYRSFGLIPMNLHLIGVEGTTPEESLFLLGTDEQGPRPLVPAHVRDADLAHHRSGRRQPQPGPGGLPGRDLGSLRRASSTPSSSASSRSCAPSRPSRCGWDWRPPFPTTGASPRSTSPSP